MELVLLELVSSKRKEKVVWNSMDLPSVWLLALPFVVRWVDLWMRGRHRRSPCLQTRVLSSSVTLSLCHRLDCSTAGYIEKLDYQVEKVLINAYILPEGWSQVVFFRAILSLITLRGDTILTLSWFVSIRTQPWYWGRSSPLFGTCWVRALTNMVWIQHWPCLVENVSLRGLLRFASTWMILWLI